MRLKIGTLALAAALGAWPGAVTAAPGHDTDRDNRAGRARGDASVQLGPRPYFLINDMRESRLKRRLLACANGPFEKKDFSIGHRGAALQFPEHTQESYEAGPAWEPASSSAT